MSKSQYTYLVLALVCFVVSQIMGYSMELDYGREMWCSDWRWVAGGWVLMLMVIFTKGKSTTKNRKTHDPLTDQEKRILKAALKKWEQENKK